MNRPILSIKNLKVTVENKEILNDITLDVMPGQVHAIMGPNGSGKSSLAYTLMGHPRYSIDAGSIEIDQELINDLSPDKRAKKGLFLAMQHPYEIEGVPYKHFLRQAYNAMYDGTPQQLRLKEFNIYLAEKMALLKMDAAYAERPINVGFSGGEKKRAEILQLAVLQPRIAILDEIDSGLDVDALKIVCSGINTAKQQNPHMAIIIITHYPRILDFIKPDFVHVLAQGKIVKSGNAHLAQEIEQSGYQEN